MSRSYLAVCGVLVLALSGCQSLREEMLAANYPPTFVDGFEAGCSSGRAATSPLGRYTKDVARYLHEPLYAQGWEDVSGSAKVPSVTMIGGGGRMTSDAISSGVGMSIRQWPQRCVAWNFLFTYQVRGKGVDKIEGVSAHS